MFCRNWNDFIFYFIFLGFGRIKTISDFVFLAIFTYKVKPTSLQENSRLESWEFVTCEKKKKTNLSAVDSESASLCKSPLNHLNHHRAGHHRQNKEARGYILMDYIYFVN